MLIEPSTLPAARRRDRGKVLVVDDNPVVTSLIEKVLGKEGFRVVAVNDPVEALQIDLPFVPELILMDIRMPNLSGIDLTRILKQGTGSSQIRVIMLTALSQKQDMERAREAGADDYLTKPVERRELLRRIDRQIHLLRAEKAVGHVKELLAQNDAGPDEKVEGIIRALRESGLLDD